MAAPYELSPTQRQILELFTRAGGAKVGGIWLNPAAIARNIGRARTYVNTKVRELEEEGLVETDNEGYYRITEEGVEALKAL